jgi:hypothetical protein
MHGSITCGAKKAVKQENHFGSYESTGNICSIEQLNQKLYQISKNNGCVK